MATASNKSPDVPKLVQKQAPTIKRRRKNSLDADLVKALGEALQDGQELGFDQTYDKREKAQATVMRVKKAVVEAGYYEETSQIASRVWESTPGSFEFVVSERDHSEGDES